MLGSLELPCINGMLGHVLPQATRSLGISGKSALSARTANPR